MAGLHNGLASFKIINLKENKFMLNRYVRGQVWAIRTDIVRGDRVFNGEHMALILGVNKEDTITVIPSTSKFNPETKILTSVELELVNLDGKRTVGHFIPNMIQTIDTSRAYRYVGMLDEDSVVEVQKAVGRYLGFDKISYSDDNTEKLYLQALDAMKQYDEEKSEKEVKPEPKVQTINKSYKDDPTSDTIGDIRYYGGKMFTKEFNGVKTFGSPISKWPKNVINDIVTMYMAGAPKVGIAYKYGISDTAVGKLLRNNLKETK